MKRRGKSVGTCMALLLSLALCVPGTALADSVAVPVTPTATATTTTTTTGSSSTTSTTGGTSVDSVKTTSEGLSYVIDVENNCVMITDYTGEATELAIPAKIDGYPVTGIGYSAFSGCSSLASVTIPDGVTYIDGRAFSGCSSLTSITIPDSVTYIGSYAFSGCSSLTEITVDAANTAYSSLDGVLFDKEQTVLIDCPDGKSGAYTVPASVTSIGDDAFSGCSSLTEITVDAANTAYSSQDGALLDKDQTMLITCPAGKSGAYAIPDGVTIIDLDAFSGCSKLTSIAISASVTSRVLTWSSTSTTTGGSTETRRDPDEAVISASYSSQQPASRWFRDCSGLTSIIVDAANETFSAADGVLFDKNQTELLFYPKAKSGIYTIPAGVTGIGCSAFADCEGLTGIAIPESVTSIESTAFYGCAGLTEITLPGSVTSIEYGAFCGCSGLTGIVIPDGVTSIGNGAFYGCSGLTGIVIPDGVTSIGAYAFEDCSSLTDITLPDSVTSIGNAAFAYTGYYNDSANWKDGVLYLDNWLLYGWVLYSEVPESYEILDGTVGIAADAFQDCDGLTSVTIPDSLRSIGSWAFAYCRDLTGVAIPAAVTYIGPCAFMGCGNMASVTFAGEEPPQMEYSCFAEINTSAIIYVPETSYDAYVSALSDCISDGVSIVAGEPTETADGWVYTRTGDSVTINGYNGTETALTVPSEIDGRAVTTIGTGAFSCNEALQSVTIPAGVTQIGESAFEDCSSLTSVTIPDSVQSIGKSAFYGCMKLQEISIPDGVTQISDYTFFRCQSLTAVDLPDSLISIGQEAFYGCSSLKELHVSENVTKLGGYIFDGCSALTLYCAHGSAIYEYAVANNVKYSLEGGEKTPTHYGDADENGKVDAYDALTVLRAVVELTSLSDTQTIAADVDGNDLIQANDALLILKHVVKLIDTFPVETAQK